MAQWTPPSQDKVVSQGGWAPPSSDAPTQATSAPAPQSAGSNWLENVKQGALGFASGLNQPLWNAIGTIPIPAVQKYASQQANAQIGNPTARALGANTTNAASMFLAPELKGGLMARAATNAALGAGQSLLTAPQEEKLNAAAGGAIGGAALSGAGGLVGKALKSIAPGVEQGLDPEAAALVKQAQQAGYTVPAKSAGASPFIDTVTSLFKSNVATKNRAVYDQQLLQAMGSDAKRLNPASLKAAGEKIVSDFDSSVKGVNVQVDPKILAIVEKVVKSKPTSTVEAYDPNSLISSIDGAMKSGVISAKDWQRIGSVIKTSAYNTSKYEDQQSLYALANEWIDKGMQNDAVKAAYAPFNQKYNAFASIRSAVKNDDNFVKGGPVNPRRLFRATSSYEQGAAAQPAKLAQTLDLLGDKYSDKWSPAMKYGTLAAGGLAGLTHLPYVAPLSGPGAVLLGASMGAGKGLQMFYETPAGQKMLREGLRINPAIGNSLQSAGRAAISQYNQALPDSDQQ